MKRSALLALFLVYAAMVGAAVVSRQTFERLPHLEDEFTYLYQARLLEKGDVSIRVDPPIRATWQPFLITTDGNNRFGKYPPGWPMLLAIGTRTETPWVVNLWFGGLTVALVYRFARELYDDTAGVAAALLMTISPIALMLNGTLMSHTTALFFALLFAYSLWRVEKGRAVYRWGALGGIALGLVVANRPVAGIAVALPFVLYCGLRLAWLASRSLRREGIPALKPLLTLALFGTLFAILFPAYNYAVVGDPFDNLYTRIWSYDSVGFGEGHGRYTGQERYRYNVSGSGIKVYMRSHAGHSLERGWRNAKRDLKCYSRDLFGWVQQPDNPPREFVTGNDCLVDERGYSWVLLPFSILFTLLTTPIRKTRTRFMRGAYYIGECLIASRWSLLLFGMAGAVIAAQLGYWIGAGVYSARYYYEATAALAILSGAGVSGLARLLDYLKLRGAVYALLGIAVSVSLIGYTPKRLEPLRGYGRITREPIELVESLRESPEIPVMVVAYGEHHWRDIGPFMALTDPYTEHDIIGLRDINKTTLGDLLQRYPDHQVFLIIEQQIIPYDRNQPPPD